MPIFMRKMNLINMHSWVDSHFEIFFFAQERNRIASVMRRGSNASCSVQSSACLPLQNFNVATVLP